MTYTHGHHESVLRSHKWRMVDNSAAYSPRTSYPAPACSTLPDDRAWWGGLWADRMTESTIARQAVTDGLATEKELREIAEGWRRWATHPDAWYAVLHGEILCRA
jgi:hypothetical protein